MKTFAHFSEWLNCLQDFQTLVRYIFSKGAIYYVKDIGNFKIWRPNIHSDCHVYIIRFRKYQSCSLSIPLIAKKTPQTINYIWIMKTTFNMIKVFYLCCIECCEHSPDQGGRRWLPSGNPWLGVVHKLRLQDEVGRWLSKCQQMSTGVGRWSVSCQRWLFFNV